MGVSDIFISYAAEDRDAAESLATLLRARGWSVWWDRNIEPGTSFAKVIEEAIASARCVIVLWSPHSVESNWVQAEASEGLARDVLIPVIIEECTIPLEFRRIEAAVIGRRWSEDDFEVEALLAAVAGRLAPTKPGVATSRAAVRPTNRVPRLPNWISDRRIQAAVGAAAVLIIAIGAVAFLPDGNAPDTTAIAANTTTTTTVSSTAAPTTPPESATTLASTTSAVPPDPVALLAAEPISETGIGPLVLGMRADEIRDALPEGLSVLAYDQQGPLVDTEGVTIYDKQSEPVLYALALPGEGPGLGIFVFVDDAFRTADGVGPGSTIAEASLAYGPPTLSYSYDNEGREFVGFAYYESLDVRFRVDSVPGDFGGLYPEDAGSYATTTEYREGATIGSVWVLCGVECPAGT